MSPTVRQKIFLAHKKGASEGNLHSPFLLFLKQCHNVFLLLGIVKLMPKIQVLNISINVMFSNSSLLWTSHNWKTMTSCCWGTELCWSNWVPQHFDEVNTWEGGKEQWFWDKTNCIMLQALNNGGPFVCKPVRFEVIICMWYPRHWKFDFMYILLSSILKWQTESGAWRFEMNWIHHIWPFALPTSCMPQTIRSAKQVLTTRKGACFIIFPLKSRSLEFQIVV